MKMVYGFLSQVMLGMGAVLAVESNYWLGMLMYTVGAAINFMQINKED